MKRRSDEAMERQRRTFGRFPTFLTRASRCFMLVLFMFSLSALPGCNILGPASYIVGGTGKIDAEYAIEDRPTVVFIDDRDNVVNPVSLRRNIGEKVSRELMSRKLVSHTISPHDAMGVAARHDTSNSVMSIDAVGRSVGAEQVIYVEMVAFQDRVEWDVPRARAICRVRVIDVVNRERLYPGYDDEQPYRLVQILTQEMDMDLYRTRGSQLQIYETLADQLGDQIAKLFYKHEARDLGGRLTPR